jgi:hypothetical protein
MRGTPFVTSQHPLLGARRQTMKIHYLGAAVLAAIGLVTAPAAIAQMGPQSSPAQATHGLPPSGDDRRGMDHARGGDGPGMEATRSGHGQGDAMGDHHRMASHRRCKMVWHHGHKVRRCM